MSDMSSSLTHDQDKAMGSYTPTKPDIKSLVTQLNLEEKILLLAGKDFWCTHPIDRLSIPSLKVSDGPNGARGGLFKGGLPSACFPAGVALAATFDKELAGQIGKALAEETRTKGATVLLGPTVCPHRDPRGGRNFESFSEDPLLAGELASEYILGLQREGVGATIKHYAVNESETKRFTIDAKLTQRALRELYLKPFEIAIKRADPWALMTSYNLVNGLHADMHHFLITKVLRGEWGFKGLVMSDWGGTNSTAESLNAGHDLEMPGPAILRSFEKVAAAIKEGKLTEETLNERVEKNLDLLVRTGKFLDPTIAEEKAIDSTHHRQLIRRAGADAMVLLKNEGQVLPLQKDKLKSVALLGLAKEFLGHGGGSAAVNAHHKITAYEAFQEALGDTVDLRYSRGASILRNLRPLTEHVTDEEGKPGFTLRLGFSDSTEPTVSNVPAPTFQSVERPTLANMSMTATFTPSVSGNHYISFLSVGTCKVTINHETIFEVNGPSADVMACLMETAAEERKQYTFVAGQSYKIKIEAEALSGAASDLSILASPMIWFQLGFATQQDFEADLLTPAVETAKSADMAIVFTGHTPTWESEGCDREGIALPMNGSSDRLVAEVAEANSKTIVVNCTGSPISMPWVNDVAAVLQGWFPGQEAGYSIADVLLGEVSPSGKLPVTFPKRIEDAPTFENFPGDIEKLVVEYKEDVFMGYRYYDQHPEAVLFPFGFGLSYTTFVTDDITVSTNSVLPSDTFEVEAKIRNTGSAPGSEVLQVYVGPAEGQECSVKRPTKALAAWAKVPLQPGQEQTVKISVSARDSMQYWDEERYSWVTPKGRYVVYVGTSSSTDHIIGKLEVEVTEEGVFGP